MLIILLNWLYIFLVTACVGFLFFQCLSHFLKKEPSASLVHMLAGGIVLCTLYAEVFSLFYKVGLVANLILLALCAITLFCYHSRFLSLLKSYLRTPPVELLFYAGVILVCAFFTSRGQLHYDTGLYHAQAIRWYEEYGVVKGIANLLGNLGYNSSYFGFAALFSLSFLGFGSMHFTTGYLGAVFCTWAFSHLKQWSEHPRHIADLCCVGILFYALVNLTGFNSPASDYATMFFALYLIARWAEEIENPAQRLERYCLLSILSVFLISLKLSAGLMILLALFPAVQLLRQKKFKIFFLCIFAGFLTVLPFLIRNVIISGWLVYPFSSLDLFDVDWKVPAKYVDIDSAYIKVYGRCLYEPDLVDMPLTEWLPIWWEEQERYAQMLVLTNLLACGLDGLILVHRLLHRQHLNWNLILLNIVTILCAIAWFLLAPFIRYGLAFLLAIPALSVGMWLQKGESSFYMLLSGCTAALMFFILTPYWDHYFTDDMVFVKQRVTDSYYVVPRAYDDVEVTEVDLGGLTVYAPASGDQVYYNYFPASSSTNIRAELRTGNIKDGFKNAEN